MCRSLAPNGETCSRCRKTTPLAAVRVATVYTGHAKDLIWKLKFSHAIDVAGIISGVMADRLIFDHDTILIHAPTATSRIRQRGFDQAALIARALSRRTSLPYRDGLGRLNQVRQVGAGRKERTTHLKEAFWVKHPTKIHGRHVVLVDDVLTSGATLEAAARALKKAGAKRVDAVVFAQA